MDEAAAREFNELIESQRIEPMRRSLDAEVLGAGIDGLEAAHHLDGVAIAGEEPVLFFRLPPRTRGADIDPRALRFLPYGWDTQFGGALTVSVGARPEGWLGRLMLAKDHPVLPQMSRGRFGAVFVKGRAPALRFDVDFASSPALNALRVNCERVRTHRGDVDDPGALFWETVRLAENVSQGLGLRREDQLALTWLDRYKGSLAWLRALLREFGAMPPLTFPAPPPAYEHVVALLKQTPTPTERDVLAMVAREHARGEGTLLRLILNEWHDYVHTVVGDHSPLCTLTAAAVDSFLFSSAFTRCGSRIPRLAKNLAVEHLDITPNGFANDDAPKHYWERIERLPVEWPSFVTGADVPVDLTPESPLWAQMPRSDDAEAAFAAAEALIVEALESRKWTVPPDALLDLPYGPFVSMQLQELPDGSFRFVLRTERGEFSTGGLTMSDRHLWWEGIGTLKDQDDDRRVAAGLELVVVACVRDFLVVEERERVFEQGTTTKQRRLGQPADAGPRVVYLPRIQYTNRADVSRCTTDLNLKPDDRPRREHGVRSHLRRCPSASPAQLLLARRYGVDVPGGFTFVRPHERGKSKRDVIYRSRSALLCLYEARAARSGSKVAWFTFERDVATVMTSLGFTVHHVSASRRGDRGVDVYATKGCDLDEVTWVIQCKCYSTKTKIGPNLVRELVGALAEHPQGTRGMLVTTASFSQEAQTLAAKHGVRLMGGEEFASHVNEK